MVDLRKERKSFIPLPGSISTTLSRDGAEVTIVPGFSTLTVCSFISAIGMHRRGRFDNNYGGSGAELHSQLGKFVPLFFSGRRVKSRVPVCRQTLRVPCCRFNRLNSRMTGSSSECRDGGMLYSNR